jgi:hypothetical protein
LQAARTGVNRDENNLFDDFDDFSNARGFLRHRYRRAGQVRAEIG